MVYNVTYVANSTGLVQFLSRLNSEVLGGYLGGMIVFMIGGVLFTSFFYSTGDPKKSAAATSVILFGLCIFLRVLALIGDKLFVFVFIAAAVAIAMTSFKDD